MNLAQITLFRRRPRAKAGFWHRWAALSRQRRALAKLDDAQLRDIGLTPEEARREAWRPLWDAPAHWYL